MSITEPGTALWPIALNPSDHPATAKDREAILADPGFGRSFTDNLVRATWTVDEGWHDARLEAYAPIALDPATNFMHYGQAIFEGLKAYRHADGSVKAFRPLQNAERFASSARRLAMAELPVELFIGSIEALVRQDRDWVPDGQEKSLYLRPFMISTEIGLGRAPGQPVRVPAHRVTGGSVLPAGPQAGQRVAVRRLRAGGAGGHGRGEVRRQLRGLPRGPGRGCPARLRPGRAGSTPSSGAGSRRWAGMNLYFVLGEGDSARLVTPALTGSLLPGITRSSLLTVATDLGIRAGRGQDQRRRLARGVRQRRDHRGVRVRNGRGHHPGRRGQVAHERRMDGGRGRHRDRSPRGCGRRSSTSRPARRPTRTTGCTPSADARSYGGDRRPDTAKVRLDVGSGNG